MSDSMAGWPPVTDADALDDRSWFMNHPARRYRLRGDVLGWWIIRRRQRDVMLRTFTKAVPPGLPDDDEALRPLWFETAWPELNPVERDALVKEARKMERAAAKSRRRQMRHPAA